MRMKNIIYLRRAGKLIVEPGQHQLPDKYMATAMKNIEYLGFTFSKPLMDVCKTLSVEQFTELYEQLVIDLKSLVGANASYRPMYPNFPEQVMLASEAELYIQAILHYITLELPEYETLERFPLLDQTDLKVIELGSAEDWELMIRRLMEAKGSISETDKEDIELVIAGCDHLEDLLPKEIPSKENIGFIAAALLKHDKAQLTLLLRYIKTATDVLRLAAAWSDGDVSLAAPVKFRKFKRSERRLLLRLLESCGNLAEDMLRYKNRWIRLGEILHPGEYKNQYAACREAFDILRNNKPFETFYGRLEETLQYKDTITAAELLSARPGEFARRLDHLVRMAADPHSVMIKFSEVADKVSTPVLLQTMTHFRYRNEKHEFRTFFPKGNVAKVFAIQNNLPDVDKGTCEAIIHLCRDTLIQRFSQLPSLGNVYVDERLKHFVMPFSQRSASKALRTIVRGSRLDMPPGDTIRFFTWWKEGLIEGKRTGRVDIDLSAVMYDADWNYVEHISYTNLRSHKYKAAHSGDITAAPNGACEFIDLHLPSILQYGGRYIVASLNSFTEHPFCHLPECYAGWMMRSNAYAGKLFEPSTVVDKVDIAADTQIAIPVILDLAERQVIWTDLALKKHPDYYNNIEGNQKGMALMGKAMTTLRKPSLYELFLLHAIARGRLVDTRGEAETVFAPDQGVTPFDIGQIMAEFIA